MIRKEERTVEAYSSTSQPMVTERYSMNGTVVQEEKKSIYIYSVDHTKEAAEG